MSTPSINLRPSTLQKALESHQKPGPSKRRKQLPLERAPSLVDKENHNCESFIPERAADKAQRRVQGIFIRFAVTQLLECETKREATSLQCGQSHCGQCECAHWASTSNLSDDKMVRVLKGIENSIDAFTPKKARYLANRLCLNTPERDQLSHMDSATNRSEFVKRKAQAADFKSSFSGTDFENSLASTIEGSIAANDFDQSIEKRIRQLEDKHCEAITKNESTYQTSILTVFEEIQAMLKTATANLKVRLKQLTDFQALEKSLNEIENLYLITGKIEPEQLTEYAERLQDLLKMRQTLLEKLPFAPSFNLLKLNTFSMREDWFWLKSFAESWTLLTAQDDPLELFKLHMATVKKKVVNPFSAIERTKSRLQEAEGQLQGMVEFGICNVQRLSYWLFGVTENKIRRFPSQQELTIQLIEMTRKTAGPSSKKLRTESTSATLTTLSSESPSITTSSSSSPSGISTLPLSVALDLPIQEPLGSPSKQPPQHLT